MAKNKKQDSWVLDVQEDENGDAVIEFPPICWLRQVGRRATACSGETSVMAPGVSASRTRQQMMTAGMMCSKINTETKTLVNQVSLPRSRERL